MGGAVVVKQVFIGDEEFVEQARRRAKKRSIVEGHYPLKRIVEAVCKVSGVGTDEASNVRKEARACNGAET